MALVLAQDPPATFSRVITTGTESVTVDFTRYSIRNANFQVYVQQADGSYVTHPADVSRTYLGTVQGRPGAIACGYLRSDQTLLARVGFEDGSTWTTTGGNASPSGSSFVPAWPTSVVPSGGAGSVVYAAELGVDSTFNHYTACGATVPATLERIEFSVLSANMVYLRDAAIVHRLGKVVIRADSAQDPYAPDGGDTGLLLPRIRTVWNAATPMGSSHDLAAVIHSGANGGLAYVGTIATSSRYSANDSDSWGDFSVVWRHEAGHNWSSSHYEGGGNPEGSTIMSNNALSRFSSSELAKIISHRNSKASSLDNLGAFSLALPPRANQDTASFLRDTPVRVDVMANDSDSNGQALSLLSFDATSNLGGGLSRSVGTGPGGRDEVIYTPPSTLSEGVDWFRYRISDSAGMQAVGYAMLRPRAEVLTLTDHWKLEDTTTGGAVNAIRTSNSGTHQNGVVVNQAGANRVTRRGVILDGVDDRISIPAPNYSTNTLTFTAWIKRNGTQNANAAIVYSRAGSSIAGLHFGTANELRYTWDGNAFSWNSGLTVPDNTWCLVAMCVSSTGTTLHLRTPSGLQSATNVATQAAEAFNGLMYLGWDSNSSSRHFKGALDDVRVYKATLNAVDIESLYQQAVSPPLVELTQPTAGSSISPLNVAFASSIGSLNELLDQVEFVDGETVLASKTDLPWQAVVASISPGARSVVARASYGDWGYSVDSDPVSFTALPAPLPAVTVVASLPASKRGPISGVLTFSRSHSIGSVTVPFTVGGSAVAGVDYTALPTSMTFADGELTKTLVVDPIAATPDAVSETVVVTLQSGAGHSLGSPSSATLTIDDHITSIAAGEWDVATTWNSNTAAPVTGTQNSGLGYAVVHTVTSNDSASNSQALVAAYLRVKNGGVLDLARLHATTLQNVSYNLPTTTVENGGTIQFRCSTGSSNHTVAANVNFSGATTLRLNAGGYDNDGNFTGTLSGSGTISVISDASTGTGTFVRQISINKANNPYAGSWSISHTGGGDEQGALRAGASNALGTGVVTVGLRSVLINDHATGLNSLSGVVLNGTASELRLNQPWNNALASLSLSGGTPLVVLGNAASSIGRLSGTVGTIQGSGSSSSLTVNQTVDGVYSGIIGTNLALIKTGSGLLGLSGTIQSSLKLTLAQGRLAFGDQPVTVASFNQTGGTLELELPLSGQTPVTVSGNVVCSGGGIDVDLPAMNPTLGVPYTLMAYQGTLTGQPNVSLSGPAQYTIDYGSGTNSAITITFYQLYDLTVLASQSDRGEVTGGGPYASNTQAAITAVAAPGWRFIQWSGTGVADAMSPSTTVLVDSNKTVTAVFDRPRSTWTQAATGGSWANAANWNLAPIFAADEWLDFSTLNLVSANSTTLDGNRTAGGLKFADATTASHDWTVATGSGGELTLATSTGLPPEIEVTNRTVSISALLAGNQGFSKTGAGTLALLNGTNSLSGTITVQSGILQLRDGSSNAPTVFNATSGRAFAVNSGAVLDLPRLHALTLQTVNWSLPSVSLQDGGILRFRAQTGSNLHQVGSAIAVAGTTTVENQGGSYTQDILLSGGLTGAGTIQYLVTSDSGSTTAARTLTVSNPANAFTGNWWVDYTATTADDSAALRSIAAGALGSGMVTLDDRATLISGATASLDSLAAVTLLKPTSSLNLQSFGWANSSAALTLQNGTVNVGSSVLSVGTLQQAGGVIRVAPSSTSVTPLEIAGDAAFSGGSIEVTVSGDPAGKIYPILRYHGTLTGAPVINVVGAGRYTPLIQTGSGVNDVIVVRFAAGAHLTWKGNQAGNPNAWDVEVTSNWSNQGNADRFLTNDLVVFDDTASSFAPQLITHVMPSEVSFANQTVNYTLDGPGAISGTSSVVKSGAGGVTLRSPHLHSGGTTVTLGILTVTDGAAFGSGTLSLNHTAGSATTTRVDLVNATVSNAIVLNSNARTGFRGAINTGAGNTLSTLSGEMMIQSGVGNGGHFSSLDGGVLRLTGTLMTSGPIPTLRSGVIEMGTTGGNLTELNQGEGTIRLVSTNGIQSTVRLNLGVSAAGILDLNGFDQTLAQLRRQSSQAVTIQNSSANPSVLTLDASVSHAFQGDFSQSGTIHLVKKGAATFTLSGTNLHRGNTRVEAGTLVVSLAQLDDDRDIELLTGGILQLNFSGTDVVDELRIDGQAQAPGVYGPIRSGATFELAALTGSGTLTVMTGPQNPYQAWENAQGVPNSGALADPDFDGVPNGIEFVVGGNASNASSVALLPSAVIDPIYVMVTYRRTTASAGYDPHVEYCSDLGSWVEARHGVNGIVVVEESNGYATGVDRVTVKIPRALALQSRLFTRLAVEIP